MAKPQMLHFPPGPTADTEARSFVIDALNVATAGETESTLKMREAVAANKDFAMNQNSATAARRAVLARQAYNARMNAEVAKVRAAYALLAAEQGKEAITAEAMMSQVEEAQRGVLRKRSELAKQRRNVLIQAMQATSDALKNVPGLPSEYTGLPPSGQQATVGMTQTFRTPEFLARSAAFFPSDIRAASGALNGAQKPALGWLNGVLGCCDKDAAIIRERAHAAAKKCACSKTRDTAMNSFCQQAEGLAREAGALAGLSAVTPDMTPQALDFVEAGPLSRFSWEPEILPANFSLLKPAAFVALAYGLNKLFNRR